MSTEDIGLTKTERALYYGLTLFDLSQDERNMIVIFLKPDDQVLMIHYLKTHPDATRQDILKETERLLIQRKRLEEQ